MKIRKASRVLSQVLPNPSVASGVGSKKATLPEPVYSALDFRGAVRLDTDRALGTSVGVQRQFIRTGLLERAVALGSDHCAGPHTERPEAARRLLAHVDALAEVGLSFEDLAAFSATLDSGSPGVLWTLVVLFGVLDSPHAEEAFEGWITSLDPAVFNQYAAVIEIADALRTQPSPLLRSAAARSTNHPSAVLRAVAIELADAEGLSGPPLAKAAADRAFLPFAAVERLLARSCTGVRSTDVARTLDLALGSRPSWMDIDVSSVAYEVAAARVLRGDAEPLSRLREREPRAITALGSWAIDLLALSGEGGDDELAREISLQLPTTPELLDALGRVGLPGLWARLLAEVSGDDFDDEARAALTTVLGPKAPEGAAAKPSSSWETALLTLPGVARSEGGLFVASPAVRYRGGQPWSLASVIAEMQRPELSASDVRVRANEVFARTGKTTPVDWDAFGVSVATAIQPFAKLAR